MVQAGLEACSGTCAGRLAIRPHADEPFHPERGSDRGARPGIRCGFGGADRRDGGRQVHSSRLTWACPWGAGRQRPGAARRSEEHMSELQSLMRITYAVFCLKNKIKLTNQIKQHRSIKLKP